jgi:hypothetical protein
MIPATLETLDGSTVDAEGCTAAETGTANDEGALAVDTSILPSSSMALSN